MAGVEGVEPSHTVPETAVLPLDDTPVANPLRHFLRFMSEGQAREDITHLSLFRQHFWQLFEKLFPITLRNAYSSRSGAKFATSPSITASSNCARASPISGPLGNSQPHNVTPVDSQDLTVNASSAAIISSRVRCRSSAKRYARAAELRRLPPCVPLASNRKARRTARCRRQAVPACASPL